MFQSNPTPIPFLAIPSLFPPLFFPTEAMQSGPYEYDMGPSTGAWPAFLKKKSGLSARGGTSRAPP